MLDPLKVVIENYPEDKEEWFEGATILKTIAAAAGRRLAVNYGLNVTILWKIHLSAFSVSRRS